VFSAGRLWDAAKNIGVLAAAAERVGLPVYVAGERALDTARAPASASLRLLGSLSPGSVADWMSRAAIYAAPALYEPFGLAILEAALAGCALVLADIPSLRESWRGAALFVDPRDPVALARAIDNLRDDVRVTRELGRAAQVRARSFTVERMGKGYLGVYRELSAARVSATRARLYS
jgi:glycosyltransferase involved in cell wall biosynthesis